VAGISERTAQKIVEYRNDHGKFRSRVELTAVSGIGPRTFEQSAGFLRIRGSENPLDSTAVHPESYPIVEQIAKAQNISIRELISRPELLSRVKKEDLTAGVYTLNDILEELKKPGRDPRDKFVAPRFNDDVKEFADLKPGMALEGVVTNVTKFGAFVDIGVHQDGLVHISELSNRYIKDPAEAVKVGQIVKVQVLNADAKNKRIALSIKALLPPAQKSAPRQAEAPGHKAPVRLDDKISVLADKWKRR
jgi:uncharacterized protein